MRDTENYFEACSIDPLLMIAIGTIESGLGSAYADWFNKEHHNPFGLMGSGGLLYYNSWREVIEAECKLLNKYVAGGDKTIHDIGATYAADPNWPNKVTRKYLELWQEYEAL